MLISILLFTCGICSDILHYYEEQKEYADVTIYSVDNVYKLIEGKGKSDEASCRCKAYCKHVELFGLFFRKAR